MRGIRPIVPGDFSSRSLQAAVAKESRTQRPVIIAGQRGLFTTSGRGVLGGSGSGRRGGLSLADFAFGWSGRVAGTNRVRINGGPVQLQTSTVWLDDAEVVVGGARDDLHVIYATSGGIAGNTARKSEWNGHEEAAWRVPLYLVYLLNGVPRRHRVVWNVVDLKTWYSAPS